MKANEYVAFPLDQVYEFTAKICQTFRWKNKKLFVFKIHIRSQIKHGNCEVHVDVYRTLGPDETPAQ